MTWADTGMVEEQRDDSLHALGHRFLDGHAQPRAGGDDGLPQPLLGATWHVAVRHEVSLLVEEAVGDDGGLARACMEGLQGKMFRA